MNIKELRQRLGLTQRQLAKKIGVNVRTLQKYEKGQRHPSKETLEKIQAVNDEFVKMYMEYTSLDELFEPRLGDYLIIAVGALAILCAIGFTLLY
jgi:transcriptional regulator with XRE-family HTH domain